MSDVIKLVRENKQLQSAVNELKVLNDIATTVSSTQPVEKIIDQIVLKCIKHLGVEEGTISLLERNSAAQEFHTMIRRQDSSAAMVPIKLDGRLTGWMIKNRSILLSNDIRNDDRFNFLDEGSYSFQSILCVPLIAKGDLIGYLAVFNKKNGRPFLDEDQRLLSIIGSQSAQVIENARLYEEEKALLGLQEEMKMAWDIQLKLLPNHTPDLPDLEITALNKPAKSVGGDYYDFLNLEDNILGFCIGDITGKGMPAAMLMANLQATFRSQAAVFRDCCKCMAGTNRLLYQNTEPAKFATLFYGILDSQNGLLNYVNGGHDAPILFRKDEEPRFLKSTGLILGVVDETVYSEESISMEKDDLLLLYTDGITEAMNPEEEEFGLERLVALVKENCKKPAAYISEIILTDIKHHVRGAAQSDDITLLLIKKA